MRLVGRKFPTIKEGLWVDWLAKVGQHEARENSPYMLWLSRRMVKEKQQGMFFFGLFGSGLLSVQLVSIAFCELSNAMAPNFSQ